MRVGTADYMSPELIEWVCERGVQNEWVVENATQMLHCCRTKFVLDALLYRNVGLGVVINRILHILYWHNALQWQITGTVSEFHPQIMTWNKLHVTQLNLPHYIAYEAALTMNVNEYWRSGSFNPTPKILSDICPVLFMYCKGVIPVPAMTALKPMFGARVSFFTSLWWLVFLLTLKTMESQETTMCWLTTCGRSRWFEHLGS